jgi:hypothetical protein
LRATSTVVDLQAAMRNSKPASTWPIYAAAFFRPGGFTHLDAQVALDHFCKLSLQQASRRCTAFQQRARLASCARTVLSRQQEGALCPAGADTGEQQLAQPHRRLVRGLREDDVDAARTDAAASGRARSMQHGRYQCHMHDAAATFAIVSLTAASDNNMHAWCTCTCATSLQSCQSAAGNSLAATESNLSGLDAALIFVLTSLAAILSTASMRRGALPPAACMLAQLL